MLKIEFATQTHTYDCYYVISRSKTKKKSIEIQQPPKKPKSIKKSNFFLLNSDFYIWKTKTNKQQPTNSIPLYINHKCRCHGGCCCIITSTLFVLIEQQFQSSATATANANAYAMWWKSDKWRFFNAIHKTRTIFLSQLNIHYPFLFARWTKTKAKAKNKYTKQTNHMKHRQTHTHWINWHRTSSQFGIGNVASFLPLHKKKNLWQARCLLTFLCEE